jgi:hypothetical protein
MQTWWLLTPVQVWHSEANTWARQKSHVHIWLFGSSSRILLDSKEILSLLVQVVTKITTS